MSKNPKTLEKERLFRAQGDNSRMQGYGSSAAASPSAPPALDAQEHPYGGDRGYASAGYSYPPAGQGYPSTPAGQGYPSAPAGQGYPSASAGQGYPPTPAGQSYPPAGHGYPSGEKQPVGSDAAEPFTPPPAGFLDPIAGYDFVTFDDVPLAPPSYDEATRPTAPEDRKPLSGVSVISQDQARTALVEFCDSKCCYGKSAAQKMTITSLNSTSAFHYTLETFTEKRSTAWVQIPFTGHEAIDSPMNGPAPMPWDIVIYATEKFKNETKKAEVPHTACVKPCHNCRGSGYRSCISCGGCGRSRCGSCGGSGVTMMTHGTHHGTGSHHHHHHHHQHHSQCSFCGGSGFRNCFSCHGTGRTQCGTCRGHGQLKCFIQLTVTWTNNFEDYILERTDMPDELIRKADGHVAFQEEQPWLYPINHCPEVSVNRASENLIEKHRKGFPSQRQLLQRQVIRIVPVTEVHSEWKQQMFSFYVYGFQNLVYSSDYPQTCCCGCTIL